MANISTATQRPSATEESRSFWMIFALSFPVLLAVALLGQLLGWHWRSWMPGAEDATSVFGGAKAAVYTFMSHLL